jgi:D-alanyl-D-alanine carboxypeptidase/D-alanyl-D-alanine-endopeptidase (penicillin-binding protein 4)
MLRSILLSFLLLAGVPAVSAQDVAIKSLPESIAAALRSAQVPPTALGAVVMPLERGELRLAWNEAAAMNPASTMKLVTTYTALQILGPSYAWRTEALTTGSLRGSVLDGELVLRGSGDPKLVVEQLWMLAQRLRGYGIRDIRGDVVLDKSAFDSVIHDPGLFDGELLRPYNAGPDALLLNFKAVTFNFVADPETRTVRVFATPMLAGLKMPVALRALEGACGDWRGKLQADFADPLAPQFRGGFPLSCGERTWHVSVLGHSQYFGATFRAVWESAGGTWTGKVRDGVAPPDARRIAVHESPSLAEVIRDINKFSNNVMARQLFLTIGADTTKLPANTERSARAVRTWLDGRGLTMPELVMENGSGLSRNERIAAGNLGRLLVHAYASPLMPEFMASLPLVGVDGTMRKRNGAAGFAHIKTGQLAEVRAVAGYVLAASGQRYAVVGIVNHPSAGATGPALDALLDWVYRNG